MKRLAKGGIANREWYAIALDDSARIREKIPFPFRDFVALIAWDSKSVPIERVSDFVEMLINAGAKYLCCWGDGCERIHDVADHIVEVKWPDKCIMTTWHDDESLAEAIEFAVDSAMPDEEFISGTKAGLAISIGSSYYLAQIELWLTARNPKNAI